MIAFRVFLVVLFSCFGFSQAHADGTYYIDEDENGVYMSTDQDGSWYIAPEDVSAFKLGETGTYDIKTDENGTYITTRKYRKFYIELKDSEAFDRKIGDYNREQERQASRRKTKVVINGNQVLVPVILGYHGNETETLLLLDTGASMTTLHREIADQLNIGQAQKVNFMIVGGKTITVDVVKLGYVAVGPFRKENIRVGIIDHEGPSVPHKGLLGMNVLRDLEYRIDFERQFIEWKS